ncbi:MAG: hypothetical protein K0B15_11725 [Lentimicrobium sp.]|nr:hypothetical protein [Lentimicrobium sp.]
MQPTDRSAKYNLLREKHSVFYYEGYKADFNSVGLRIEFSFMVEGLTRFNPVSVFHFGNNKDAFEKNYNDNKDLAELIIFNIGMIELVSYWKTTCAPKIIIIPGILSEKQVEWWKKLYFNGLGEFFYLNGLQPIIEDFTEILSSGKVHESQQIAFGKDGFLIPVGGGKDSAVTLELLKSLNRPILPLIINPRGATLETVDASGFDRNNIISISRSIDKELLRINSLSYLNGHTPFSAMLAFYSLLASLLTGHKNIALSNESSANEATIPGTHINHQYSKSFEFEQDFREYCHEFISPSFNYFSFLRPLNELQIVYVFSRLPAYHKVFKSCNVGSKTDSWCGKCPKCLFTSIMMAAFTGVEYAIQIIGSDMLNDQSLVPIFDELSGISDIKPFECVGTLDDVNNAMQMISDRLESQTRPFMVERYLEHRRVPKKAIDLSSVSAEHNLSIEFLEILKSALL